MDNKILKMDSITVAGTLNGYYYNCSNIQTIWFCLDHQVEIEFSERR